MNAQDEIAQLREEIATLKTKLAERQQLDQPKSLPSLRSLIDDQSFIEDLARFADGVLTEKQVRQKYHLFDESTWVALNDDALVERIELERTRRIRSGATKRELAQNHIVRGPQILNTIMSDPRTNAKHKVDAIKTLDSLADPGPQRNAADEERVIVTINLGSDVLRFGGAVRPTPNDNDGEIIDNTPQELLPIIAANKRTTDGGNGNAL